MEMCGKFTQMMAWAELVDLAELIGVPVRETDVIMVTPVRDAFIIRRGPAGARQSARMRWGFIPGWARNPMTAKPHFHARAEEIETKRTFADSFFARRGILVARDFSVGEDVTSTKRIQHRITPRDGKPIAMAVIWDSWREPHGGALLTFAMITVPANKLIGAVTDRMPAILQPADWTKWLGEEQADVDVLKALLKPFEGDWDMQAQTKKAKAAKKPAPEDDSPMLF